MWYMKSYQNWNTSSEVLLKVKSRTHLTSIANGIAMNTWAPMREMGLWLYWSTEEAFFIMVNPYFI